jgi:hypothetical protein
VLMMGGLTMNHSLKPICIISHSFVDVV